MVAVLLLYVSVLFLYSAQRGLTATIGQQHVMSGQVSAAWNIFEALPGIAALLAGGVLSDLMEGRGADQAARLLFLVGALIAAAIGLFGLMKPGSVFGHLHSERLTSAHPWEDFGRLLKHWPIYPALFIWLLWNFAPGSVTSLQFYLQNTLHAKDAQWGQWNAIFAASFIPTFLVFGALCRRFPLKTLLLWGTVVAVPQFVRAAVRPFGDRSPDRRRAHRADGRGRHRRLSGPDHPLGPQGTAGHGADGDRRFHFHRRPFRRCPGH